MEEKIEEKLDDDEKRIISDPAYGARALLERKEIKAGTYWTPLEELYEPTEASFEGGYQKMCLRMTNKWKRPKGYEHIMNDLKSLIAAGTKADDISVHSADSKSTGSGNNKGSRASQNTPGMTKDRVALFYNSIQKKSKTYCDCLGGMNGNKGHIIPAPKSLCAPRYGIMAQTIIGYSFEEQVKEKIIELEDMMKEEKKDQSEDPPYDAAKDIEDLRHVLKKVLQKSVISDKQPHGLASLPQNWLYVPENGHEKHFDIGCQWFFVPVLTLEHALLEWKPGQSYKVMVLAGDFREDPLNTSAELYKSLVHEDVLKIKGNGLLEESEIRTATTFLQDFVRALADMATGRGNDDLTPEDLDREGLEDRYESEAWQIKLGELDVGKANLANGMVHIPDFKVEDFSKVRVLGVTLNDGPDPCCLGIKDAMGIMAQLFERPLPGCKAHESSEDSESEEEDSDSWEGNTGFSSTPPREITYVPTVTPPPPRRQSLGCLSLSSEDAFEYSSEDSFDNL